MKNMELFNDMPKEIPKQFGEMKNVELFSDMPNFFFQKQFGEMKNNCLVTCKKNSHAKKIPKTVW